MIRNRKQILQATLLISTILLALPLSLRADRLTALQPNISVNGFFSADKGQQGRTIQAAVVLDIPSGFHINSDRPLAKYLIPTSLKIEAPGGIKVGPVSYPRASLRNFSFSQDKLSVYEGRVVLRFTVTVPANFATGVTPLRARLRYQSCNEEACFPPSSRVVEMPIAIVGSSESAKRINGNIFGGGKRGR
jgi:DsbC/DsbD-like thiol-disulfide interchange protein